MKKINLFIILASGFCNISLADYIKISNEGNPLPDNAYFGTAPNDWGCTYDTNTKLTWENKTNDKGLRDYSWRYTWYDPNPSTNGGFGGISLYTNLRLAYRTNSGSEIHNSL